MCLTIDDTRELIYAVCELESHPSYTYMQSLVIKQCISSLVEVIIVKKMASPNFTEEELSVMLEHISFHVVILSSAHINSVTQAKKNEIWKNIANEVSSLGVANREIKDIREKWRQLKSAVLTKKI